MEYDGRAPFLAHNLKLLEDTEYLQQKGRRVDLLGDEGRLYEFFEARVPEGIATGAAFERWRREAEAQEPKLLWLTERDIAASDAELEPTASRIISPPARWSCSCATDSTRATRTMASRRWCRCMC